MREASGRTADIAPESACRDSATKKPDEHATGTRRRSLSDDGSLARALVVAAVAASRQSSRRAAIGDASSIRARSIAAACRSGRTTSGSRTTSSRSSASGIRRTAAAATAAAAAAGGPPTIPTAISISRIRLQQLTSLEADPNGKILELTDDALFDYPFIYMIEPGDMYLGRGGGRWPCAGTCSTAAS